MAFTVGVYLTQCTKIHRKLSSCLVCFSKAKYQYWSNKVLALILTILTICVELELRIVFDVTVGGVPIGFNILRTWVSFCLA